MIHPLFQQILGSHGIAQSQYDRQEPVDDREDDDIEQDAADRAQAKRDATKLAEATEHSKRDQHLWDAVEAKRKLTQLEK